MKAAHVSVALLLSLVAVCEMQAQPRPQKEGGQKKAKSEADVALDKFFDLVEDKNAKQDQARFQRVAATGFDFIAQHPRHNRILNVVKGLGMYGTLIPDKTKEMRPAWTAYLKYEILNRKSDEKLNDEARTAILAVDASLAEYELYQMPNRPSLMALREKIDALAAAPANGRLLPDAERAYALALERIDRKNFEPHLRQLTEHANADVAKMGREMLNIAEVSKGPYAMKFTALDGKEFDFEKTRGKAVALVFWSSANPQSTRLFTVLKETHSSLAKKGFEVVTVSYDKAEDRSALEKYVKENKIAWPVYFDGAGSKNEFGQKLNVQRVPVVALFNKEGVLVHPSVPADQLDNHVRRVLGLKVEAPQEMAPEPAGARPRGR